MLFPPFILLFAIVVYSASPSDESTSSIGTDGGDTVVLLVGRDSIQESLQPKTLTSVSTMMSPSGERDDSAPTSKRSILCKGDVFGATNGTRQVDGGKRSRSAKVVRFSQEEPIVIAYVDDPVLDGEAEDETEVMDLAQQEPVHPRDFVEASWKREAEEGALSDGIGVSQIEGEHVSVSRGDVYGVPDDQHTFQVSLPKEGMISDHIREGESGIKETAYEIRLRKVRDLIETGRSGTTKVAVADSYGCYDDYFLQDCQAEPSRLQNIDKPRSRMLAKPYKRLPRNIDTQDGLLSVEPEIPDEEVRGYTRDGGIHKSSLRMLIEPEARGSRRLALDLTDRVIEPVLVTVSHGVRHACHRASSLFKTAVDSGRKSSA